MNKISLHKIIGGLTGNLLPSFREPELDVMFFINKCVEM